MATAHQIRDLIAQTTTGTARPHVPREVRDEVCRYAPRSPSRAISSRQKPEKNQVIDPVRPIPRE